MLPSNASLSELGIERAHSVFLFGSRAAGCSTNQSDVDLLCIGERSSIVSTRYDIVWLDHAVFESNNWLGSELAGHVARWGRCLKGDFSWASSVFVSARAIERKQEQISGRLAAILRYESGLSAQRLRAYWVRLRRDVQRLDMLIRAQAVAPSAMLDAEWECCSDKLRVLDDAFARSNINTIAQLRILMKRPGVRLDWCDSAKARKCSCDLDEGPLLPPAHVLGGA